MTTAEKSCARAGLAAYIDGDLSPREELELELHLAACKNCAAELNEQKKMLGALDCVLESQKEIELPVNFTAVVLANAQSKVNGLRCPRERFRALFVCSVLFLLVVLGLGWKIEAVLETYIRFAGQILAVIGFTAHLIYDVCIGAAVILRSLGSQFVGGSASVSTFLIALLGVSLFVLSRLFVRFDRA